MQEDAADEASASEVEDIPTDEQAANTQKDVADEAPASEVEDIPTDEQAGDTQEDAVDEASANEAEDVPTDEQAGDTQEDTADEAPVSETEDVPTDEQVANMQEDTADEASATEAEDVPTDEQTADTQEDAADKSSVSETEDTTVDEQPIDAQENVTDETSKTDFASDTDASKDGTDEREQIRAAGDLQETSEINSVSDYMNAHNYGQDDFATYSQDPQWRQLMRQEYPDYELPEMTHESANAQLSQYMNDHNYGVDDYAEYSQNPIWRELHSAAFPDDELPPISDLEITSDKNGIFSSIFGRNNDVTESQPVNQILQSEQGISYPQDLRWEYDTSFEAQELRDLGIKNVDLRDCSPEYRGDIVDAVRDMVRENPELKDQLSDVRCYPMQDGTYASYGPTGQGVPFGGKLNLNSKYFSSNTLRADLEVESQQGWSIPNASPHSIVSHELGHGVHLGLCAKSCGIVPGTIPDAGSYSAAVRQYMDDVHADRIVETACKDVGVEFDSWDFANQLTRYGASNYGEAIAEAVAEVRNNSNPRPMASAIYSRLMQYKNNMNGGTLV